LVAGAWTSEGNSLTPVPVRGPGAKGPHLDLEGEGGPHTHTHKHVHTTWSNRLQPVQCHSWTPLQVSLVNKDASMLEAFGKGASEDMARSKDLLYRQVRTACLAVGQSGS
jgi:hypothetical protein